MKLSQTILKLLLIPCIIPACLSCNGQTQADRSKAMNTGVKLPPDIWSIYQDRNNHYWFGSNGKGVFRYDGTYIIQYSVRDGLAAEQTSGIQEDADGNIYFDTPEGISKFDGHSFSTLQMKKAATGLWRSEPGDLWFKGSGNPNGVYRYDGDSLFFLAFPEQDLEGKLGLRLGKRPYSPYGTYSIYKDKEGNMWFGTLSAGVYRFDGASLSWIAEKELAELPDGRVPGVRAIIEDKDGFFWLSNIRSRYVMKYARGVFSYEKQEGLSRTAGAAQIRLPYFMSAVTDANGDLWMVSYDEGVWQYDGKKLRQYRIKDGTADVLLYSIYKDNQGTLWLGTHNAGVYRYDGKAFQKFTL